MPIKCPRCPRKWYGLSEAHCATCHEHFGSMSGFDKHRKGGECLLPAERGLVAAERRGGPTWVQPDRREHVPR